MDTRHETVTGGRMVTRELADVDRGSPIRRRARRRPRGGRSGLRRLPRRVPVRRRAEAVGPEHRRLLRAGRRRAARGHDHRHRERRRSRRAAALANGTMALGFEYADFGAGQPAVPLRGHRRRSPSPSPSTAPGEDLALAIVIGYEVMGRVFHATFERGKPIPFYVPSVYGTIAGAAGCARAARARRRAHQPTPSGSPARSPAAPSRATRRVRGSARSTAAWPASAA